MTAHPSDMTAWPEIRCQRGCAAHATLEHAVDLSVRHAYADYCAVPQRLALQFRMHVWDTEKHPIDGQGYCPARDAVSETIVATGIWEPPATCMLLDIAQPGAHMLDFGCQIGWFSLLAAHAGMTVDAYDADADNLAVLAQSRGTLPIYTQHVRVGVDYPDVPRHSIRFVKIDLEGAEAEAVELLDQHFDHHAIDHMLIEISPCFRPGDHYPDLVERIIGYGFEAYLLPPKNMPPLEFTTAAEYLAPWRIDQNRDLRAMVAAWDQRDVWFRHSRAAW